MCFVLTVLGASVEADRARGLGGPLCVCVYVFCVSVYACACGTYVVCIHVRVCTSVWYVCMCGVCACVCSRGSGYALPLAGTTLRAASGDKGGLI